LTAGGGIFISTEVVSMGKMVVGFKSTGISTAGKFTAGKLRVGKMDVLFIMMLSKVFIDVFDRNSANSLTSDLFSVSNARRK
jgi:hypothetical protein